MALSPWETLNNVVGLLLLVLVDDALEKLNDNFVLNIRVSLEGLRGLFASLKALVHLKEQLVAHIYTLELGSSVELFNHAEGDVVRLAARGANNYISLWLSLLKFLDKEINRIIRFVDDQLLHHPLK